MHVRKAKRKKKSTVIFVIAYKHTMNDVHNDSMSSIFIESSSNYHSSIVVLILILSILSCLGVIFMIFGPMMRSEAIKRVDNYVFGRTSEQESRVVDGIELYDY